jgi:Mg-chelatase subunit ChlD
LEGLRHLIALLTSAAEIGAMGKKSEATVSVGLTDGRTDRQTNKHNNNNNNNNNNNAKSME